MLLSRFFQRMANIELANLSLVDDTTNALTDKGKTKVIEALNSALLQLFTDFNIKQNDLILLMQEGVSYYHLTKRFAEYAGADSSETVKYILDQPAEMFADDVIKILSVMDSEGHPIPLNDESVLGLYTPQFNMLQVLAVIPGYPLNVVYQARHAEIPLDTVETLIDIPYILEEALGAYTAFKVYSSNNSDGAQITAQGYLNTYNSIKSKVILADSVGQTVSNTNTRFNMNGWV